MKDNIFVYLLVYTISFGSFFASGSGSEDQSSQQKAQMQILSLVDYIAGDYSAAVGEGGVIRSAEEYAELMSFAETALRYFGVESAKIAADQRDLINSDLVQIETLIKNRGPNAELLALAQQARQRLIANFNIKTFPNSSLSFEQGARLYQQVCASCHGDTGRGDGVLSAGMQPPPRNFHEREVVALYSPFKVYNTLVSGIEGTQMQSYFGILSNEQMWDISFYLMSLPHSVAANGDAEQWWRSLDVVARRGLIESKINVEVLASLSDTELRKWLQERLSFLQDKDSEIDLWLADIRRYAPYSVSLMEQGHEGLSQAAKDTQKIENALIKIANSEQQFMRKDYAGAEASLLAAYLDDFEGCERPLILLDSKLVQQIEQQFIHGRAYALAANESEFNEAIAGLRQNLSRSKILLGGVLGSAVGSKAWADFGASFVIIVREGFEAFLIVAALLALLTNLGLKRERFWVHAACLAALVAGFISYALFEWVLHLSGAAKETIEAVTTGFAVLLLFYTGFWLLSQSEHRRWQEFIRLSSREALSKRRLGSVFMISFMAVYREAVETVLFYEALLSGSSSSLSVGFGFVAGCIVLLGLCAAIMKFNLRLPLQQFFRVTSILMLGISIVLMGKLIHELVEAGYFQPTPIPGLPVIEVIGLYPSMETVLGQAALISTTVILALYKRRAAAQDGAAPHSPS